MNDENLKADPSSIGGKLGGHCEPSDHRDRVPHPARALVARMVEAGEWPEPQLLEQIVGTGVEAVEPLLAILKSKACGWPAEAPLHHAIGLLEVLRPPAAVPDLIAILKRYGEETGQDAVSALAVHGEAVFDRLLELAGDPTCGDDTRNQAISAARKAAGANPTLRTRLADLLRPMLAEAIEQARRRLDKSSDDKPERDLVGDILFRVEDLAVLADPLARDLIKTAFAEDLVETSFINEKDVDDSYSRGGDPPWVPDDWLASYRDYYQTHLENKKRAELEAKVLVEKMVQAGGWPPPGLLQQIVKAGDAAVEPLHDLLRTLPREWKGMDSLSHAIGLLSDLRRPETVPELAKIVEEYEGELCADAAGALIDFGEPGFLALVDICANPALTGYQRATALEAAVDAAGQDHARRSRLAAIARPMLDQAIATAREELKSKGFLEKHPHDDDPETEDVDEIDEQDDVVDADMLAGCEDDPDDEADLDLLECETDPEDYDWDEEFDDEDNDGRIEPFTAENVAIVAGVLATIADPLARDTIMTAFDEGLIDESVLSRTSVDERYHNTGESPEEEQPDQSWLDAYREDYAAHLRSLEPAEPASTPRAKYRYEDRYDEGDPPTGIPATAPIRNTGPKVGRNDPCWCGSGKKYKKCHLGRDPSA